MGLNLVTAILITWCTSFSLKYSIWSFLLIRHLSGLFYLLWLLQPQVKLSDRVLSTEHGLLIRSVQLSDQGLYYCLTTENGFKRTVAKIRLRVLSEAMVSVLTDKQQSPWAWASSLHPKVLLAAFSPAESLAVQQYCKERKELQNLQQRQQKQQPPPPGPLRGDLAKLKPLLDRRKSRNRRNHLPEVWHLAAAAVAAAETDARLPPILFLIFISNCRAALRTHSKKKKTRRWVRGEFSGICIFLAWGTATRWLWHTLTHTHRHPRVRSSQTEVAPATPLINCGLSWKTHPPWDEMLSYWRY